MTSLVDLGKANFVLFLKTWLNIEEICFLDAAFCNKVHRPHFLKFISSKTYSLPGLKVVPVVMSGYAVWLRSRSIYVNQITLHNNFIQYLKSTLKFHKLVQLSFPRCWDNNQDNLVKILTKSCNLTSISLTCTNVITDFLINELAKTCTQLTDVSFHGLVLVTDISLSPLFAGNLNIRKVDISGCISIGDKTIIGLANHCNSLTYLDVSNCKKLSDISIDCLAENEIGLIYLNLSGCMRGSVTSLVNLLKVSRKLTGFDVDKYGFGMTGESIVWYTLAKHCPQLKSLYIYGEGVKLVLIGELQLGGCLSLEEVHCKFHHYDAFCMTPIVRSFMSTIPLLRHIKLSFELQLSLGCEFSRNVALLQIIQSRFIRFSSIIIRAHCLKATKFVPGGVETTFAREDIDCSDVRDVYMGMVEQTKFNEAILLLSEILQASAETLSSFSCPMCDFRALSEHQPLFLRGSLTNLDLSTARSPDVWSANEDHEYFDAPRKYIRDDVLTVQLKCVFANNPCLTRLNLMRCKSVADSCMYVLVRHCQKMRDLNLSRTAVTDNGVFRIAEQCKVLQHLTVDGCWLVSYKSLKKVMESCKILETLSASGVPLLPAGFKHLLQMKYNV